MRHPILLLPFAALALAGCASSSQAPERSGGVPGGVAGGAVGGVVRDAPTLYDTVTLRTEAAKASLTRETFTVILAPGEGSPGLETENYAHRDDADFHSVLRDPLSTFSIDVDTASYARVRRYLAEGARPPADAVRIEELLNYFVYDDPLPAAGEPFSVTTEVAACPWNASHRLLRIALRAVPVQFAGRRPGHYVFLVDVSGSMDQPDKLPLVQQALKLLAGQLTGQDLVSIVAYAGAAGVVLPPTAVTDRGALEAAIENLQAGGSTAGGEGILLAYALARERFVAGGINRVVLATDGDFNVGVSSEGELTRLIEEQAKSGVFLTVLGFGTGNLQDAKMEALADRGNGQFAYIDSPLEARRALVEQAGGTLVTVAKDVKIQVEFNPAEVAAYRLIGYENRLLAAEDFRDDAKDAGEIGAGHSVVALYEIVPPAAAPAVERPVDPLRYQALKPSETSASGELGTVKLRFKAPDGDTSVERAFVVMDTGRGPGEATSELKFAASVAAFGMVLRDSPHRGGASIELVRSLAEAGLAYDPDGQRAGFLQLVDQAGAVIGTPVAGR
jgi:Ca-activated chloride channel family protein